MTAALHPEQQRDAAIPENPAPADCSSAQVGRVCPSAPFPFSSPLEGEDQGEGSSIPSSARPEGPDPHTDYFEHIYSIPPIICGRQMKVLSIARYRLMRRFKVAFVSDAPATATAGDLLMGVLICSLDLPEFFALIGSRHFQRQLDRWGRKFGFFPPRYFSWPIIGKWLYRYFGAAVDRADAAYLTREIEKFQKYIQDNSKSPLYWDESENDRISGAHWSQSLEVVLRGQVGWTKAEVEDESLNKAIWDFYKHMETLGLIRLMTQSEVDQLTTEPSETETAELLAWATALKAAKEGRSGDSAALPNQPVSDSPLHSPAPHAR